MGRPVSSVELESWLKAAPELRSLPKRMGIMQALPFCLKRFCRFTVFISPHTLHPLDKPAQFLSYFLKMFVLFIYLAALGLDSACNAGDLGSIPGLGRSPGEGKGYPLQYSGLENSMDSRVHGIAKSQTQLSDFHFFTFLGLSCGVWGLSALIRD